MAGIDAVENRFLKFESLTLRHKKPVNKPVYRLFNFCLKGKARTIFGFQGRKSAVLPGTEVPSRFMRKIVCRLRLNEVSRQ